MRSVDTVSIVSIVFFFKCLHDYFKVKVKETFLE